jgi:segregation and condensation protein B
MVEKKTRKKKNELLPPESPLGEEKLPDADLELRNRFGAADFVENISNEEDEEESNVLSLDSLREAFAALSEENRNFESESGDDDSISYDIDEDMPELDEAILPKIEEPEEEQTVEPSPRTILEAMLFVGNRDNRPLSAFRVTEKMRNVSTEEIDQAVAELNRDYQQLACPYTIQKESDGYRMVLRSEFDPILMKFYGKIREAKLSQQAIDTLAVVAYRQPISSEEVQKIRKQPSSALLSQLVRRGLLGVEHEIRSKKKIMLYKTTDRFLELFQLDSIDDLPVSEEINFR